MREPLPTGTSCDDDDPCTADDRCDGQGTCTGTPACLPEEAAATDATGGDVAGDAAGTDANPPDDAAADASDPAPDAGKKPSKGGCQAGACGADTIAFWMLLGSAGLGIASRRRTGARSRASGR